MLMILSQEKIKGASLAFTVSAFIEVIYFGLGLLLFPVFAASALAVQSGPEGYMFLRFIGILALALGFGCWSARDGEKETVRLMSKVMITAKGGTALLFLFFLAGGYLTLLGWVNTLVCAFLAAWNYRLLNLTTKY